MNYDELNRFNGSLTYSIRRFIFSAMAQGGGAWPNAFPPPPLNTLLRKHNYIFKYSLKIDSIKEHAFANADILKL